MAYFCRKYEPGPGQQRHRRGTGNADFGGRAAAHPDPVQRHGHGRKFRRPAVWRPSAIVAQRGACRRVERGAVVAGARGTAVGAALHAALGTYSRLCRGVPGYRGHRRFVRDRRPGIYLRRRQRVDGPDAAPDHPAAWPRSGGGRLGTVYPRPHPRTNRPPAYGAPHAHRPQSPQTGRRHRLHGRQSGKPVDAAATGALGWLVQPPVGAPVSKIYGMHSGALLS